MGDFLVHNISFRGTYLFSQFYLFYYLKYLTFSSGKTDQSKFGSGDFAASYRNET